MNAVSILRAIHDIYESHNGGTIRLTVEEEDAIIKLIQQWQNLPLHNVRKCVFCDKPPLNKHAYCEEHMKSEDWS